MFEANTIDVLLVEDNVGDIELLRFRLHTASTPSRVFRLTAVQSLAEALELLQYESFSHCAARSDPARQ